MEQLIFGNIRVQLLSENIVRIEYGPKGCFCDKNTFFIPDRGQFANTVTEYAKYGEAICFNGYVLYIPENAKSLAGVRMEKDGKKVYTYKKLANSGELPALDSTPEVFAVSDTPRIIVPEGGYSAERKGEFITEENVQDIYLLLCGCNAAKLRNLYIELTGRSELVRLSVLGGWNSKYYAYSEETAKQLILDYEKHSVPLDVMVIDTDWRSCENGWGYEINTNLFPDMQNFIAFAHGHGVEVMFNDHPEPVNGAQVFAPEEIEYREKNLQTLMEKGLDIWWYDRNWSSSLVSPVKSLRWETLGLYLFNDITKHQFQKTANNSQVYRRPVIMGNIVNVANGYYQGISDSASHRYSIQWTGDISSGPDDLAQEIVNMLKCGNNAIPYANADCGGHAGNPDKEGFIRWMQFGTLSPVFRPHCTNSVKRFREPWVYDEETLDIVREYNNLRYRLLPVIYKNAYQSYVTGEPVFKALGWEYPADKRALKCADEYMLGNNILIKPIAGNVPAAVEKSRFVSPVKATYYNGTELKGEPIAQAEYDNLDIVLNHTSPENGVPVYNFSARFETEVQFDTDVELAVRSDDGVTVRIDGEKVLEDKTLHSAINFPLKVIEGGKPHKVEIEYFQAGGEAAIVLCYSLIKTDDRTEIYLPEGKWLDLFDGKLYAGGKIIKKKYGLKEMPLFVRAGALLPLAYEAKNTKEQKWKKLVCDFYPDKCATDSGYLYEDDTETTAYKYGQYKKSEFSAEYNEADNSFTVNLYAGKGAFKGDKNFKNRELTVKYHLLSGVNGVKRVTVNGADAKFKRKAKNKAAFPLNTGKNAPDAGCLIVRFKADTNADYQIKFYL